MPRPAPASTAAPPTSATNVAEPAALPEPPSFVAGPLEVVVDRGAARTPAAMLARRRELEDFTEHVTRAGFTADGSRFVHCAKIGGAVCTRCTVTDRDGERAELVGGEECGRSLRALERDLDALGLMAVDGAWQHGRDLLLSIAEPAARGKPLKLGATRRDGGVAGFSRDVDTCEREGAEVRCWPLAEVDVAVPAPDGQLLAAVVHFNEGEHEDAYRVVLMPAGPLAAAAYRAEGLAALARSEFAAAAALFHRETHADPTAWKGPYNLACAYARAGAPATEAALREAVRRDGAAVRRRAVDDADLASVRDRPWFAALVGGS